MKKIITTLIITSLLIGAIFINNEVKASLPLSGKLIILDPGHGGLDPGSTVNNIHEKNINLAISKYLEIELTKVGASVILTRDGDYDLSYPNAKWRKKSDFDNRIKLINNSKGDMYLSIHLNYLSNSSYSGPQVFYNNDENQNIAKSIQETMNNTFKSTRETKKIPTKTYMYSKLTIPGVLIECGFLSNPTERTKLTTSSHQKQIAQTITDGIINYYQNSKYFIG